MGFPDRFIDAGPPGYPELTVQLCTSLRRIEYLDLQTTSLDGGESEARLLALLVRCYNGKVYEAHGFTFDLSTPEGVKATLQNDEVPEVLRAWLRNAPIKAVEMASEQLVTNWRRPAPDSPNWLRLAQLQRGR